MFIPRYITNVNFDNNILTLNETVIEFKQGNIDNEIVESLISKNAYASLLLYLNKNMIVEKVNGNKLNASDYVSYLQECKNMLKENVYEIKASDFKPLVNIDGLEILENDKHIVRGKTKLFVEDFKEEYFSDEVLDVFNTFNSSEFSKDLYISSLNKLSELEWENVISSEEYERAIKKMNKLYFTKRSEAKNETLDEDGTQVGDIAPKVDQEIGMIKPEKKKDLTENISLNINYNHKFKGFTLCEDGIFRRGNYILVNESGKTKAVHKKILDELDLTEKESSKAKIIDEDGNYIWDYNYSENVQIPKLMKELSYKMPEYDFDYRIEDNQLVIYDKNEEFDFSYMDDDYDKLDKIVKELFGVNCYIEAQTQVIGVVAGMYIKDLN